MNENQKKSLEEFISDLNSELNIYYQGIKTNYAKFSDVPDSMIYIDSLIDHLIEYRTIQNEINVLNIAKKSLEHFEN